MTKPRRRSRNRPTLENISDTDSTYEVGYKSPPKKHQFPKGQSGNPKGRPKGGKSFRKLVEILLDSKVTIQENGRPRMVTRREAAAALLVNKTLKGDHRAFQMLLLLINDIDAQKAAKSQPHEVEDLDARDRRILDDLFDELIDQKKGKTPTRTDDEGSDAS